ncbi:hypothetical protein, partial [Enterobacter hormaechei]|uniref:hypothetical protein n=1 Tax=Enterobacter hormaechei TaxID=158836 RepID=UPI001EEE5C5C
TCLQFGMENTAAVTGWRCSFYYTHLTLPMKRVVGSPSVCRLFKKNTGDEKRRTYPIYYNT